MTYDGCFPRSQPPGPADQPGMSCDQSGDPLPKRDAPWECAGVRGITQTPARFQEYITLHDCIYFTLLTENVQGVLLNS